MSSNPFDVLAESDSSSESDISSESDVSAREEHGQPETEEPTKDVLLMQLAEDQFPMQLSAKMFVAEFCTLVLTMTMEETRKELDKYGFTFYEDVHEYSSSLLYNSSRTTVANFVSRYLKGNHSMYDYEPARPCARSLFKAKCVISKLGLFSDRNKSYLAKQLFLFLMSVQEPELYDECLDLMKQIQAASPLYISIYDEEYLGRGMPRCFSTTLGFDFILRHKMYSNADLKLSIIYAIATYDTALHKRLVDCVSSEDFEKMVYCSAERAVMYGAFDIFQSVYYSWLRDRGVPLSRLLLLEHVPYIDPMRDAWFSEHWGNDEADKYDNGIRFREHEKILSLILENKDSELSNDDIAKIITVHQRLGVDRLCCMYVIPMGQLLKHLSFDLFGELADVRQTAVRLRETVGVETSWTVLKTLLRQRLVEML